MNGTGKFATQEEIEHLQELLKKAQSTPVILLFGKHDLSGDAWKRVNEATYECALKHGLPEIDSYYGMKEDGEFVTV